MRSKFSSDETGTTLGVSAHVVSPTSESEPSEREGVRWMCRWRHSTRGRVRAFGAVRETGPSLLSCSCVIVSAVTAEVLCAATMYMSRIITIIWRI